MRWILICLLAGIVVATVYLFAARSFSLLVDRFYTVTFNLSSPDHFRYDAGVIEVGSLRLYTLTPDVKPSTVAFEISGSGRAALVDGAKSFPLGAGRSVSTTTGLTNFVFTPDAGDTVQVAMERSLLSWPTPFATNFMTGSAPSWKRNLYCRLTWTKRSQAKLVMLWRVEQGYFGGAGWRPDSLTAITSGLVSTSITSARN